jgi:hypothetical protein
MPAMPEELGIYRGEVLTIMEALADLRVDVGKSESFWKRMKRKRSKKEISEQAGREAEKDPVVRALRQHAARIREELSSKRRAEGSA